MLPKIIASLVAIVVCIEGAKLPSFFNKCSKTDPNLGECMTRSGNEGMAFIKNGIDKYRLPSLRPLKVPHMTVDVDSNLQFNLTNSEISGIDNLHIRQIKVNLERQNMEFKIIIPQLEVFGTYGITGRILFLPIVGSGLMNTTFINVEATYSFDFDKIEKNGNDYMLPKNSSYIYDTDRAYFRLDNLFNGNKALGIQMSKFLDENWREVNQEIGARLGAVTGELLTTIITRFLSKVPYDEMFL